VERTEDDEHDDADQCGPGIEPRQRAEEDADTEACLQRPADRTASPHRSWDRDHGVAESVFVLVSPDEEAMAGPKPAAPGDRTSQTDERLHISTSMLRTLERGVASRRSCRRRVAGRCSGPGVSAIGRNCAVDHGPNPDAPAGHAARSSLLRDQWSVSGARTLT